MARETIIRGRLLAFLREPRSVDDAASYLYEEDGALLVRDGKVAARGDYAAVNGKAREGVAIIDHRPQVLVRVLAEHPRRALGYLAVDFRELLGCSGNASVHGETSYARV